MHKTIFDWYPATRKACLLSCLESLAVVVVFVVVVVAPSVALLFSINTDYLQSPVDCRSLSVDHGGLSLH